MTFLPENLRDVIYLGMMLGATKAALVIMVCFIRDLRSGRK